MTATANVSERLAETVGAARVTNSPEELATYAIDGLSPSVIVRPNSVAEIAEIVRFALAEKLSIVPLGSRSKCDVGMPLSRYDIAVDVTPLREVAHYDPGDLTLSIDAGMPLREVQTLLRSHGQFLPLAVPCFERTTVGGTVASGIDSILRMQYGSARDFLIGAEFVDGTGQLCRSGGRVVKNVTGYDLHKLLIGSQGTLAVITRLNFRTFPVPAARGGQLAFFADCESALRYRETLENSGLPLANLEILSPEAARCVATNLRNSGVDPPAELDSQKWCASVAYEGNDAVVRRIARDLQKIAREACSLGSDVLEPSTLEIFEEQLREAFDWLRRNWPTTLLCRIAIPDVSAQFLVDLSRVPHSASFGQVILVRAAGLVYITIFAQNATDPSTAALARAASGIKALAARQRGHATILHAPAAMKAAAVADRGGTQNLPLDLRVKQAFDPANIFASGRVVGGL